MAKQAKTTSETIQDGVTEDFSAELIKQINKEHNEKIAFNLGTEDAPINVKRWIPSGSRQLDYIISNQANGGWPEGRIVEIQGIASIGKSHIAFELSKSAQKMGGIVIYIDTENATSLDNLTNLGIDTSNRFVFVQSACTEEILSIIESAVIKARAMTKDVPVVVIWDSVSQSSPKAELEGDYEQNTIGLQARILSRGLRKISNIIANQKVLLYLVSQQRMKIGCVGPDTIVEYRKIIE